LPLAKLLAEPEAIAPLVMIMGEGFVGEVGFGRYELTGAPAQSAEPNESPMAARTN